MSCNQLQFIDGGVINFIREIERNPEFELPITLSVIIRVKDKILTERYTCQNNRLTFEFITNSIGIVRFIANRSTLIADFKLIEAEFEPHLVSISGLNVESMMIQC